MTAKQTSLEWFKSLPENPSAQLKIEVACKLNAVIAEKRLSKKELARRLQSSRAWMSKVLRGDANLSMEALCRLAEALNCKIHIHFEEKTDDFS